MAECGRRCAGFQLTLRQQMIGVVYFALIFAMAGTLRGEDGKPELFAAILWSILFTPWLLGFLVLCLDRPGPLKNWMVPTLFLLFPAALALGHDWITMAELVETGTIRRPLNTLALNVFLLGSFAAYWLLRGPAECPACGRVALIPLLTLWGRTFRTTKTRWCARCGALYWRTSGGSWRVERRRTWLDPLDVPADDPLAPCPGLDGAGPAEAASAQAVAGRTPLVGGLLDAGDAAPALASVAQHD